MLHRYLTESQAPATGVANRRADLIRALAASVSRSRGGDWVTSEASRVWATSAICSTAVSKAASFALEGRVKPLIFRTNCSEASRISSSVTGGAKLKSGLMFLHMG